MSLRIPAFRIATMVTTLWLSVAFLCAPARAEEANYGLSVTEWLARSTVRIATDAGQGTGFFFRMPVAGNPGTFIPVIITNRHVIAGADTGRMFFTMARPDGAPLVRQNRLVTVSRFSGRWIQHPDPHVDLVAMPLTPLLDEFRRQGILPFYTALYPELIPDATMLKDLSAAENVLMFGYPNGLADTVNNLPIIRRGITATPAFYDFNGRPDFVVDIAALPGSSGSPVFLANLGGYADRQGNPVWASRVQFIGVMYAGPRMRWGVVAGETELPMHLGFVVRAEKILEFQRVLRP